MEISSQILSDLIVHMKYAKFIPEKQRRETWEELVTRNKDMHIKKYPALKDEIEEAYTFVMDKKILPSMRSMQFAGKPIQVNPARIYNCSFLPMDDPRAFSELMFLLLAGVGVGYSVQRHHVENLPEIRVPRKKRRYLVGDSIEGWSDAVKVLISAYYNGKSLPDFDFSDIRPKGARLITSGGKAPGPEPLKDCLHNIQKIFDRHVDGEQLSTTDVHDINCYIADAVLSGGIRRSAMIALFDVDDQEMATCKFGNSWHETNPQRGRANNSMVILRHKIKKDRFQELWKTIELANKNRPEASGEPGIYFTNDKDWGLNPCAEISLRPFQFCNLVTTNVSDVYHQEELNNRVKAASFIATLQAGYTNFHYLRDIWRRTTEKEALIGVSMTGIASHYMDELNFEEAAEIVKKENERVADIIGINSAARCTTVKPEGTTSLVLGSSSGIHPWHNDYYLRRIRVGKNEAIYHHLKEYHSEMVEDEYFKPHLQSVVHVPIKAPDGAITRKESAMDLLARVSHVWRTWVRSGHRKGSNYNNVSTTISIHSDEWDDVGDWMWNHRDEFTALSIFPATETETTYVQAPMEDISKEEYENRLNTLHTLDLTKIIELDDDTTLKENLACFGGACEIV